MLRFMFCTSASDFSRTGFEKHSPRSDELPLCFSQNPAGRACVRLFSRPCVLSLAYVSVLTDPAAPAPCGFMLNPSTWFFFRIALLPT